MVNVQDILKNVNDTITRRAERHARLQVEFAAALRTAADLIEAAPAGVPFTEILADVFTPCLAKMADELGVDLDSAESSNSAKAFLAHLSSRAGDAQKAK